MLAGVLLGGEVVDDVAGVVDAWLASKGVPLWAIWFDCWGDTVGDCTPLLLTALCGVEMFDFKVDARVIKEFLQQGQL